MKTLLVIPAMVLFAVLSLAPSIRADDSVPTETISAMVVRWEQVLDSDFSDADQVQEAMRTLAEDKAVLQKVAEGDGGADPVVVKAIATLASFEQGVGAKKSQLSKSLQRQTQVATMMAKKWESVANQALANGVNPEASMIEIYKRTTKVNELLEQARLYAALAGVDDATAADLLEKVAYIEDVGVRMGAVDQAVTPRDVYAGSDKQALTEAIVAEWKAGRPEDEILGVRFMDKTWNRRTEKRFNNTLGWYPLDFSSMDTIVVVKEDDHIAGLYTVHLTKDHLNGDALEIDVESAQSNPGFKSQMLVKNYTP